MKSRIRILEKEKNRLLQQEEARWRLKSRALWMKNGDKNSKFFHKYANARRERNYIWEIKDDYGNLAFSQEDITSQAVNFLKIYIAGIMRLPSTTLDGA